MRWIAGIGDSLWFLVVAFAAAAAVALVLTPVVRTVALRLGMVDVPDRRRVNDRPVPRAGGVAIMAAFVTVGLIVVRVNDAARIVSVPVFLDAPELIALFAGAVAAALLGVIDDYLQVRARWQLAGQLLLALWAVGIGIGVDSLYDPLTGAPLRLVGPVSIVFTTFWIVGMVNAINFIDGLDGLSSGIGFIAALALGVISLTVTVGQPFITLLCLVLAGALLGFLRWNFHPASICAGTSGTMFLGYTLALLSILYGSVMAFSATNARLVLAESGLGWPPWIVQEMDYRYARLVSMRDYWEPRGGIGLTMKPSATAIITPARMTSAGMRSSLKPRWRPSNSSGGTTAPRRPAVR